MANDIIVFLNRVVYSLNARLKGKKCPYCGREIEIDTVKLKCCRRLVK